jgi:hypothetical protein
LQRRYYWIHDPALENIVLVHYRNDLDCHGEVSFSSLVDKFSVPGGVVQSSDLSDSDRSLSCRFSMSNRDSAVSVHSDCSLDIPGPTHSKRKWKTAVPRDQRSRQGTIPQENNLRWQLFHFYASPHTTKQLSGDFRLHN